MAKKIKPRCINCKYCRRERNFAQCESSLSDLFHQEVYPTQDNCSVFLPGKYKKPKYLKEKKDKKDKGRLNHEKYN